MLKRKNKEFEFEKMPRHSYKDRQYSASCMSLFDYTLSIGLIGMTALIAGCSLFSSPSTEIKAASSDVQITTTTEIEITPPGAMLPKGGSR